MSELIKIENLSFSYIDDFSGDEVKKIDALIDVNMRVNRGEFIAVLGHNGSGKSTLAKHLNAILTPSSGHVIVAGLDTGAPDNLLKIRQKVGMVFQNPDNQLVATIVEEDVAFAPENLGVPPDEIRGRVDHALKAVGMYEYAGHAPHRLSGGQKQRVAIAGVLAMDPEIIVMDEPTAMLDPLGRREIMKTIKHLNREADMTVVLITHFMDEAVQADRVVIMNDGEIFLEGPPREVFTHVDTLKSIGLDVPQATELTDRLIRRGKALHRDILTAEECACEIERIMQ